MYKHLSLQQKQILAYNSGYTVVKACPGSGKTYSVAALISKLIYENDFNRNGIAALSFTNVACEEIIQKLKDDFGIPYNLSYPHIIATLDSFINNFIFLPFGHLIMKCDCPPKLVGSPHYSWTKERPYNIYDKYFDKVSYNIKGELIKIAPDQLFNDFKWQYLNKNGEINGHIMNLFRMKDYYHKKGYASQTDANYFSLNILERYPLITKAIANKFKYLIIDEAQDTDETHMRIIDLLKENGAANILLIGDSDQAIFEWNNAKPELFEKKFNEWNTITLNENRRSSQQICNVIKNLSSFSRMDAIDSKVSKFQSTPQVLGYKRKKQTKDSEWIVTFEESKSSVNKILSLFCEECNKNKIPITPDNVAVLFRGKSQAELLLGSSTVNGNLLPWKSNQYYVKDIIHGKFLMDRGAFYKGYKLLEKGLLEATVGREDIDFHCTREYREALFSRYGSFQKYRRAIFKIIDLLPSTINCNLSKWIDETNKLKINNINLKVLKESADILIESLFEDYAQMTFPFYCNTIHSAKGRTFEAVLVLIGKKDKSNYSTMLNQLSVSEALRIVYVGISRPRKILFLVTPEEDIKIWEKVLGFNK